MLRNITRILLAVLLFAAIILVSAGIKLLVTLDEVAEAAPAVLDRAVERESGRLQGQVTAVVTLIAEDLKEQITEIRGDLKGSLADLSQRAERQISLARKDLKNQAAAANQTVAVELSRTNDSLAKIAATAEPLHHSLNQVESALPMFLDCDHNPNCVFNRYVGTMRGLEQMSIAVGKSAPNTAKSLEETSRNVAIMTGSVATITQRVMAPKPWYRKLGDMMLGGAALVRLLQ